MGSEARARLGLGALLAATLFCFGQLFVDDTYAGPTLLGMLIAAGVTFGARRLGLASLVTFLISGMAMLWYVSVIFEAGRTLYGLPTPGAIEGLWLKVQNAYELGQIDFAPVPMRPGYVLLVIGGMWLATTVGEIATFRWHRPFVASGLPLGLFAFLMIVGTGRGAAVLMLMFLAALLTYWGLESSHRLRSWGRWMHAFTPRSGRGEPQSVAGGLGRRMGAGCLAIALTSPLVLPTLNEGLLSWRGGSGDGEGRGTGGVASSGQVSLLVQVKPRLIEQSERELFRVVTDNPDYWALTSLVTFDGDRWLARETELRPLPAEGFETIPPQPRRVRTYDRFRNKFQINGLEGSTLPTAINPVQVGEADRREDLLYELTTGTLKLAGSDIDPGFTYEVDSHTPRTSFRRMKRAEVADLDETYTQLPTNLSPQISRLAHQWTRNKETPFEKLVALQDRLRGPEFTYSLDVQPGESSDYLLDFLTKTRTGYCQQFATAFAVLARTLEYPTRINVGFLPGTTSLDRPDLFIVKGTHYHAWPEVYFEDYGWVRFEPTPRADAPVDLPDYTIPGLNVPPLPPTGDPGRRAERALPSPGATAGEFGTDVSSDRISTAWQKPFKRVAIAALVAFVLFVITVPLLKQLRIGRRSRRARKPADLVRASFFNFEAEAGELAEPRHPSESATAYARRLARLHRVIGEDAVGLAAIYEAVEYGRSDVPEKQARRARRLARDISYQLWREATWWERARRLWSPATLISHARPVRRRLIAALRPAALLHRS
jgi:transglutaminase-like putative cysteine protease